jgi:hypothetical protein
MERARHLLLLSQECVLSAELLAELLSWKRALSRRRALLEELRQTVDPYLIDCGCKCGPQTWRLHRINVGPRWCWFYTPGPSDTEWDRLVENGRSETRAVLAREALVASAINRSILLTLTLWDHGLPPNLVTVIVALAFWLL